MMRAALASLLVVSQAVADPKPPPPPPPPPAPSVPPGAVTIKPAALEKLRTSGNKTIEPTPATRDRMQRDGVKTVTADIKLCISTVGFVVYTELAKRTGYQDYDLRLTAEIADWMFQPYKDNGKAVPACTTVTIDYKPPPAQKVAPYDVGPATPAMRADVDMICGAAAATGGTTFMEIGPYIAQRMKTALLADLFANIRTTTTLDMIVDRVRAAMTKTRVTKCATIDVLLAHRPR